MSYRICIKKQALKELEELPAKESRKVSAAIDSLGQNPRPTGCKKLKGESEYFWRIRVGNYRVLYKIDDKIMVVEIGKIGNRKNVYE
jgi:mRNA interferase RelE/StbE